MLIGIVVFKNPYFQLGRVIAEKFGILHCFVKLIKVNRDCRRFSHAVALCVNINTSVELL